MFSQLWEAYAYFAKEGALGETSTAQRISHGFKREINNFLNWTLLSPSQLFSLKKENSEAYDGMDMMSCGNSIYLGKPMIFSITKEISEHDKRISTLLHAWAKLRKFWKTRTIQGEVHFHLLQSCLEQDQLQRRQKKWASNTPTCGFGIRHAK